MSNKKEGPSKLSYVQLGQLADITMGQSPDSSGYNTNQKGLPFLQGCAEFGRLSPIAKVYCNPPLRISRPESILISVRAPVGTQNWGEVSYCIGRGLSAIKGKQGIANTKFLSYAIAENIKFLHRRSQGSTFLAVGANDLRVFPIPNFDSQSQDKISTIIGSIDNTIEKTEALIEKYQKVKDGLMHDLLSRGVDHDSKLRASREHSPELYQETSLGWFPKDWQLKRVKDVFNIDSGITLGSHRRPKQNARPYLRVANVFKEKISLKDVSLLEATDSEASRYALKKYDLLVVEGHASIQQIGRCAIVDNNAEGLLFQNHLFRLQAKTISPYYGMYYLNSAIARKYWEMNCSTSSGLNTINRTMLGNMPFFVPARTEQASIEEKLNGISLLLKNEIDLLVKLRAQKIGLMNDLLTGKVPVQSKDTEGPHV
ncbi:restriction endonuclease subunit S [Enterobacter hormaechei]|uniref:restriction endonuclease subunit S n=1 Tax=Enterobacter hormaechei TaxID=158836 RepID=UPI000FC2E583|nr:restriction endonuclease subunit S [Enterobacter hormaechei]EBY2574057.1 restriction endonuclease subunit S [Salmonella enterica subsp. enterica serovar Newport]EEO0343035.1 hypothetical protein [Salmonella enterica]ECE7415196.1 restriction endonuclease subunit S [Salmonella enterica subsp. enterica serovar Newport]EKD5910683.1 restriction endonuclease subunit S [Salmonella enterica subsp. enterica serovar Newport]EKD5922251.1 restriction endonuclease subunit S [Salmonella enterica subsp. e